MKKTQLRDILSVCCKVFVIYVVLNSFFNSDRPFFINLISGLGLLIPVFYQSAGGKN